MLQISLAKTKDIHIPGDAIDRMLDLDDSLAIRLYIYLAQSEREFNPQAAAGRLNTSADRILAALDLLVAKKLVLKSDGKVLERSDAIPEYTVDDVSNMIKKDEGFSQLLDFTQKKLGKILSTVDTKALLGIYNWMGLPIDVICLVITYCIEDISKKYGEGRRPTMKNIENQARLWLNMGILTTAQAEDYLRRQEIRGTRIAQLSRMFHLTGRVLSATENKYLTAWADAGYSDDLIMKAYDVTVVMTGKLTWNYMDKVLKNWESEGYKTDEDVERAWKEKKNTGFKMSEEQIAALRRAEELSKKWGSEK